MPFRSKCSEGVKNHWEAVSGQDKGDSSGHPRSPVFSLRSTFPLLNISAFLQLSQNEPWRSFSSAHVLRMDEIVI